MKKIVFVDGSQGVGKTTLVRGISERVPTYVYKFPFSEYSKIFSLKSQEALKGFQLGKDLATMYFLGRNQYQQPLASIVDRGPISTVYYSLTTGRMSTEEVEDFFKILSGYTETFSFSFIVSKNQREFKRDKNDGFDGLKGEEVGVDKALKTIVTLSKKYKVPVKIFENDFSLDIEKNITNFYKSIKEDL